MEFVIGRNFLDVNPKNLTDEEFKLRDLLRWIWKMSFCGALTFRLMDSHRRVLNGKFRQSAPEGETKEQATKRKLELRQRVAKEMQKYAAGTLYGLRMDTGRRYRNLPVYISGHEAIKRTYNGWQRVRTRNSACVAIFDAARLSGERNHDDSGWASPPIRSPYEIRIARDGAIISVGDAFKAADEMVFFFASRENDLVRGRLPGVLSKFYATKVSVPPGLVKKLVKEGHIDAKWLDAPVEKIRNTDVIKVQLITKERVAAAKKRGAASLKKFQEANGVSQQRQLEG